MRRLASQERDDTYGSRRDYQEITNRISARLVQGIHKFEYDVPSIDGESNLFAVGGFLSGSSEFTVTVILSAEELVVREEVAVNSGWTRFGFIIEDEHCEKFEFQLLCPDGEYIDCWGLVADRPSSTALPSSIISELDKTHLIPETLYLSHDDAEDVSEIPGVIIRVKKCSYCQRYLPVHRNLVSSSFHNHASKISGFQNECRSCKKWRINDTFNPLRTPDQLHESSVITREKSLLLREPEILQRVKERTGAGLRSQVWERFERMCFKCKIPVLLKEFHLDHTRPLSYLWPIDEFATCLCGPCNNAKHDQFPVQFYTVNELQELSGITGLDLDLLVVEDVNEEELNRILENLLDFTRSWDSRTFLSIHRRVQEYRPEIDMFELLEELDVEVFQDLIEKLSERANPVIEE
jgi:hypothetical protein